MSLGFDVPMIAAHSASLTKSSTTAIRAAGIASGAKRWRTARGGSRARSTSRGGSAPQTGDAASTSQSQRTASPTGGVLPACDAQDAFRFSRLRRRVAFWASAVPVAVATAAFFAT